MFDEFVEHTAAPIAGISHAALPLPQLQYEGFEPSPNDPRLELEDIVNPEEAQFAGTGTVSTPIFDLERVQFEPPAPITSLVISSDVLVMGLSNNYILLIELSHAEQVVKIPIQRKSTDFTIYKIFLDPSGRHLLVTSTQGENWYLYRGWKKPRLLKTFKMVIESVAWNKPSLLSTTHSTSTKEMLIGARNGTIYEAVLDAEEDFFKSQERYCQAVFSLPEKQPITGIKFDFLPPPDAKKALVLVTTTSRIYQFVGVPDRRAEGDNGRVFAGLFASYKEMAPKILELPGDIKHSELAFYTPNADQALSLPRGMAWMTGPGIYHGTLNYESTSEDRIDSAQLLPYPSFPVPPTSSGHDDIPSSIAITQFHFVLLYRDQVIGICNLDEKLTYEEIVPLKINEEVRGLTADPVRGTYWVYTNQSIFELRVDNESRDVWKIYLEKGQFDIALRYAKTAGQRDHVLSAQAHSQFDEGKYFPAAQSYAQCSVTFEEVTLKFLDVGERDALRSYLISRLERSRKTDLTQRMMLATWLVEFYLSKCNELDDIVASESVSHDVDDLQAERTILEDDLRHFFDTYKSNLDQHTVYELIQGHGRTDMYLYFATAVGDYERVVEHHILEEEWTKAMNVIVRQTDLEMYYRFAPVLIRQVPKETVDSWLRQPLLDPIRLVPALLQLQHVPRSPVSPNHAVRYLNHVIFEQQNISPTIHNLLITFHASVPHSSATDDAPLLRFLSTAPSDPLTDKPYYDLDYALRLCKSTGRTQPCVHIYSKMGLWENSVDLALEKGDLELAKINADMPEDDEALRKKLWLKIARYVVQDKQDIKTAMRFLENTDLLKIEDILPFFPNFVVIDDFKEEIAHALEGYSAHIEVLKGEMDEATNTAESIKQDIAKLKNRFVTIDAGERCSVCSLLLLTRQFYVFPCQHTFHADCLIGLAKEHLPAHALRKILLLQTELLKDTVKNSQGPLDRNAIPNGQKLPQGSITQRTLLSANFGNLANPIMDGARAAGSLGRNVISAGDRLRDLIVPDALAAVVAAPVGWIPGIGRKHGTEKDGGKKVEKLRAELDEVLASTCPLCESVVAGLDKPFVKEGELDTSWAL